MLSYPFARPATQVDWYVPKEIVPGPSRPLPRGEGALSEAQLSQLAAYAKAHRSIALVVLQRGHVILERYFEGHGPQTRSNAFSLSKTVLALLLGIAQAEGKLSISDPIARYIPSWRREPRGAITLEQLLWMRSGLSDDDSRANPLSYMVQVHMSADLEPALLEQSQVEPPGARFDYNNLNSQLLGLALERATGVRYAEYLSKKLWAPLGAAPAAVWLDHEGGRAKTYCCIFATALDWARVGQLLLSHGQWEQQQLAPKAWIERMLRAHPQAPNYGLHIWLAHPDYYWLDGMGEQRVYVVPKQSLVIVRLGETDPSFRDAQMLAPVLER